jgi:hypothetical protein
MKIADLNYRKMLAKPVGLRPVWQHDHPLLGPDCLAFWPCHEGAGWPQDIVGRRARAGSFTTVVPTWNAVASGAGNNLRRMGVAVRAADATTSTDLQLTSGNWTVWVFCRQIATVAAEFPAAIARDPGTTGWGLKAYNTGVWVAEIDADASLASTTAHSVRDWNMAFGNDAGTARLFISGVQEDSSTVDVNPSAGTADLVLGHATFIRVYAAGVWRRWLGTNALALLNTNPLDAVYWEKPKSIFIGPAAAAAAAGQPTWKRWGGVPHLGGQRGVRIW